MIGDGSTVTLHYTGTLADGTVFDSSKGRDPLTFTVGKKQVVPGFEDALRGLAAGEQKTFTVKKEDAYPYRDDLIQKVPKSAAPPGLELNVGAVLALRGPNGEVMPARVVTVEDDSFTLDLNLPVAGKDLTFAVEIVKVD